MKTAKLLAISVFTIALSSMSVLSASAVETPKSAKAADSVQNQLPNVAILATGGTIASRGAGALSLTDYGMASGQRPVGIQQLVDAVPEIQKFANISGEQVFNIGSSKLSIKDWLKLANRVNEILKDPKVDGIVITHGTDTMEETAYFLNLVTKSDKPVVLVAAMRPSTAISADGPLNLVNAVALSASKAAKGKGVMVVMNDQISPAFGVTKTNSTNVATFKCPDTGYMGYMQNNVPYFVSAPTKKHTLNTEFDIAGLEDLPRVDVNYVVLGSDGKLVDAMVKNGAKGIVNAGVGHANMPNDVNKSLSEAAKQGVVVVAGSRVGSGMITPLPKFTKEGYVSAMMHNPQKARILLMLALTKTNDPKEIQRMFNEY